MASISSSRKGRPNTARDTDSIEVRGDFSEIVKEWRQATYKPDPALGRWIGDDSADIFELQCDCLSFDGPWNEPIRLTDRFQVPESTVIPRGSIAVFRFTLKCDNRVAILANRDIVVDDDARILDLVEARDATEEEVRCAIDSERPAPRVPRAKPAPEAPTYTSISRADDPGTSRLGFVVGPSDMTTIKVGERWGACGFHLASSQIAGRLAVSLSIHPQAGQSLQVKLFDARGTCQLSLDMQSNTIAFDQRRFSSGDYLIAWRSPGPGVEGTGSYHAPHARLLDQLPEQPTLDSLILEPQSDTPTGECAVPHFRFSSR